MILHVLIAMVAGWLQRHQQQAITLSWLRVFRHSDALCLGYGGRQAQQTAAYRQKNVRDAVAAYGTVCA